MIKTIVQLVLASTLMAAAAPAFSEIAMQMWRCEIVGDASEEDILSNTAKWLKVARTLKGGENLNAAVHFPVAVNATDKVDMLLTVTAPSFEEWGRFWDAYIDSDAEGLESEPRLTVCPNSVLWQSYIME
jgi:hypothetical protein